MEAFFGIFIVIGIVVFVICKALYYFESDSKGSSNFKNKIYTSRTNTQYNTYIHPEPPKEEKQMTCLLCGSKSGDNHFCYNCYIRHKDHTVILSLEKCRKATVEEKYYEGMRITAADGHIVRSDGERAIDNYLYYHQIPHAYELKLYYRDGKAITPDFYLPQQDAYIEFLGYSGEKYLKENEYKRKIYTLLNKTVIYLYRDDKDDIDSKLDYYVHSVRRGELNHIRLDSFGNMVL